MPTQWTDEQRRAIESRGGETLVSAGAGSGKTTVLAERIVRLIDDARDGCELNRIAALTFTDASALEMRRKIRKAIEARLAEGAAESPERLERALLLLDRAYISTLHSFCLRIVREHFSELGLDPRARVTDEEEARLLQLEAMDALLESLYADESEAGAQFENFVRRYGSMRSDMTAVEAVMRLRGILQADIDPQSWRERAIAAYEDPAIWEDTWREIQLARFVNIVREWDRFLEQLPRNTATAKFAAFAEAERATIAAIGKALKTGLAGAIELSRGFTPERMPPSTKLGVDPEAFKNIREEAKGTIKALGAIDLPAARETLKSLAPYARMFVDLAHRFDEVYRERKLAESVLDYNDLERAALRLLDGGDEPTAEARRIRDRFSHVIIDECQDINPVQERILELVSAEGRANLFMVGDVKQSIYSFRLANPHIFMKRWRDLRATNDPRQHAHPLSANFRSRKEILRAVNSVFERLFARDLGDMSYTDEDRLHEGLAYGEPPDARVVEFVLIDDAKIKEPEPAPDETGEEDGGAEPAMDSLELEAQQIGERLLAWTHPETGLPLFNPKTGERRAAQFSDAMILMRTLKGRAATLARALRAMGIAVTLPSETDFFESLEIKDALSLLRTIDNPRQDAPLAAVMLSPFGGFDADELAQIRMANRDAPFHRCVLELADDDAVGAALAAKLQAFEDRLNGWRTIVRERPLAESLRQILHESAYADYALGLPGGERRRARLDALLERARRFGAYAHPTLYRFLRHLDDLEKRSIEFRQSAAPEDANAVQILSIHQAKGLEFPIVFLPDLANRFNFSDTRGDAIFDRAGGIGLNAIDLEDDSRRTTIAKRAIAARLEERARAEEARLLYVAMTRAMERLVLLGTANLSKAAPAWISRAPDRDKSLRAHTLVSARCALDWLGPIVAGMPEGAVLLAQPALGAGPREILRVRQGSTFCVSAIAASAAGEGAAISPSHGNGSRPAIPAWAAALRDGRSLTPDWRGDGAAAALRDRLLWRPRDDAFGHTAAKFSVSEIKGRLEAAALAAEGEAGATPAYYVRAAVTDEASGALREAALKRGEALHAAMQRMDLGAATLNAAEIARQIDSMAARGFLDRAAIDGGGIAALARLFASEFGAWLVKHRDGLQREIPFCAALPVGRVEVVGVGAARAGGAVGEARELGAEGKERTVLVQGTIDALVSAPDGLWLIDYKTDAIAAADAAARARAHVPQMALYCQAIEQIARAPLAGAAVVFVMNGESVRLDVAELREWRPVAGSEAGRPQADR